MDLRYVTHSHFFLPNGSRVTTGLALLSKFPITHSEEIRFGQRRLPLMRRLINSYVGSKRALRCVVDVEGTELGVINAHLTHNRDGQKEYELEEILKRCMGGPPCLLMGDLNTTPLQTRGGLSDKDWFYKTDEGMEILAKYNGGFQFDPRLGDFVSMPPVVEGILTAPSGEPDKKIDYIFLFPGNSQISLSSEEVPDLRMSDHRPVLAKLTLNQ